MSYAGKTRPPRSLTDREVARLLKVTGEHRDGFRDNVIISLALGCALRESEIVALDVGDVTADGINPRRIIQLRVFKRAGKTVDLDAQRVHVPDATWYKLKKYLATLGPPVERGPASPLFPSRQQRRSTGRLSTRRVREMFRLWQQRAGFDQLYGFHVLRHTAISKVRRETRDIRIAQRVARHASIATTAIYDHPSDEEIAQAVKGLQA